MEPFIFVIVLLFIGVLLQKTDAPVDFSKSLNVFIIYVSLPATVLIQVPKIVFNMSALSTIIIPWLLLPIIFYIVILMTKNYPTDVRAALLLVLPLGNTSFIGIPIIKTLIGPDAIGYALMYDQFGTFLMLALYGSAVISYYEIGKVHKRLILKKLLFFPPFFFLVFALFFGKIPLSISPYLETLASTLVPIALVSVGYSLHLRSEIDYSLLSKALVLKLIVMPFIAFGILFKLGIDPIAMQVSVLESGMPSMITAGALAIASGFAPALSAAMVGYGIIICLVTLPLIVYAMQSFL